MTPNSSALFSLNHPSRSFKNARGYKIKVGAASDVQLVTSNPDLVIIERKLVDELVEKIDLIRIITPELLHKLEGLHQTFVGKCGFEQISGYVSVKFSLRPDRRLQISHEGSLMKAIYAHLQTREWIINPKGLRYFAMVTKAAKADRIALKTVATHSLTTVFSLPQMAVDEVYEVDSMYAASEAFSAMLK